MADDRGCGGTLRRFLVTGAALALSVSAPPAHARDDGEVAVRTAYLELEGGVFYLNARLRIALNEAGLEALDSGLPLNAELQITVSELRRFLWDKSVANLRQRYRLRRDGLSQRYVVLNMNSGDQSSHATLNAALSALGRISDLPVIDEPLLDPGSSYEVRIRAVLDIPDVPAPLRPISFFFNDWRLSSDWYSWPLQR